MREKRRKVRQKKDPTFCWWWCEPVSLAIYSFSACISKNTCLPPKVIKTLLHFPNFSSNHDDHPHHHPHHDSSRQRNGNNCIFHPKNSIFPLITPLEKKMQLKNSNTTWHMQVKGKNAILECNAYNIFPCLFSPSQSNPIPHMRNTSIIISQS